MLPHDALFLDYEVRSRRNIRTEGLAVYVTDPSTTVLCAATLDPHTGEKQLWLPGQPVPNFRDKILYAWNAQFEKCITEHVLKWPRPKAYYCVAAHCRYTGAPGKLATASDWFGLGDKGKDKRGTYLVNTLCMPLDSGFKKFKIKKGEFCNDPTLLQELYDYCHQDNVAAFEIYKLLPEWPQMEYDIWLMTVAQNERGCPVDIDLCKAVVSLTSRMLEKASATVSKCTNDAVDKPTKVAALVKWLNQQGVNINSLDKNIVAGLIKQYEKKNDIEHPVYQVLKARQVGAPASIKKFSSTLGKHVGGRLYHNFIYAGGGATGRWSGGGKSEDSESVQLHNLKRGTQTEEMLAIIKTGDLELFETVCEAVGTTPVQELQNSVRSLLCSDT